MPDTRRYRPKDLSGTIAFTVVPDESDPHEAGQLEVVIDAEEVRLRWAGTDGPGWRGSWTELRDLIDALRIRDVIDDEIEEAKRQLALIREPDSVVSLRPGDEHA